MFYFVCALISASTHDIHTMEKYSIELKSDGRGGHPQFPITLSSVRDTYYLKIVEELCGRAA